MTASPPMFVRSPDASTVYLPAGDWITVLDALCARFSSIDRVQWLDRIARGRVLDGEGRAITARTPFNVDAGMRIHYFREVAKEPVVPFTETILHVDEHLVVADKPHFLPVTPAGSHVEQTLLRRLLRQLENPHLVPLHRIDRLTAGLVLFSPNPASRSVYQALFREQRIDKRYAALAPPLPQLTFPRVHRSCMVAGEPFFRMREVDGEPNSETRIEVIDRGAEVWRYGLYPRSGKKHQLRVHMAALGAPIIGDPWYPMVASGKAEDFGHPLQLVARALSFVDPLSGEARHFESRLTLG